MRKLYWGHIYMSESRGRSGKRDPGCVFYQSCREVFSSASTRLRENEIDTVVRQTSVRGSLVVNGNTEIASWGVVDGGRTS
jgi:hypothetical protein